MQQDIYNLKKTLDTSKEKLTYYSLPELEKQGHSIKKMPFSIRILLEPLPTNHLKVFRIPIPAKLTGHLLTGLQEVLIFH